MNALGDVIRRLVQVLRSRSRVKAGSAVLIVRGGIHVLGRGIGRGRSRISGRVSTERYRPGRSREGCWAGSNHSEFPSGDVHLLLQLRSRPQRNHRKTTGLQPLMQR